MNIDRSFKGNLDRTIELFDDGMCDGPDLQVGRQYLMYTTGFPNGGVPARGCTRSRRVEDAGEDLAFLDQYSSGKVTTHIDGTVRFRPDEPEDSRLGGPGRTPLKNVEVTISSNGKSFRATTMSDGGYSFVNLDPGEYTVDADLSGYRLDWAPDSVLLVANGCFQANLLMTVDRRVEGYVRDDRGVPVSDVLVEMVSADQNLKRSDQPILLDISDEGGHYTIAAIPPGDYYLGVNIKSTPTREQPYPSTYYPNTPNLREAVRIDVVTGAAVQEFDLRIPNRLPLVTIRGKVQTTDGKPPLQKDHPQVRIKEPGLHGQIEQEPIKIDAEGRFHFELCQGIKYSAFAFSGSIGSEKYSAPLEFTPTAENDRLVLTLDKTPEEFLKLRRR